MMSMRKSRRAAKKVVNGVRNVATVGTTMAVGLARFAVDIADEGVKAFDQFGADLEKKLEGLDHEQ